MNRSINNILSGMRFQLMAVLVFILISIGLISCEKNISVDIPGSEQQLVLEGYVYEGMNAYVFVTKSSPFFSELDSSTIQKYIVRGATITLSDGITTDTLLEYENPQYFLHIYYSPNIIGVTGRTYTLRVVAEGKVATAITSLPPAIPLDSVWWIPDGNKDSLGFAWA